LKNILLLGLLLLTSISNAQTVKELLKKATKVLTDTTKKQSLSLNQEDIAKGLKEALTIGAEKGCTKLSQTDAFFKNAALKIVMPPEAQKVENTLRSIGLNQLADDFILSMNRAAEDACKTASPIFVKAIKEMSITDGITILKGQDSAATVYLRSKTQDSLNAKFKPIIKNSLDKVDATKYWEKIVTTYNAIPFVNKKVNPDLAAYVTEKSMKGIYSEIAAQEKDIRANPVARTTDLLKRVFNKK
jgi:hypothetical protein